MGDDERLKLFVLENEIESVTLVVVYEHRNGDMCVG